MTTPFHFLKPFFEPQSIAIIGASRKPGTLGNMFLKAVLDFGYSGHIYPVHPSGESILGLPSFRSIPEIPETPDLAVIMVRRDLVKETLVQCGEKGIRHVIIITAGFREVGEEGKQMEAELVEVARRYHIRFIGPNCMGLFNTHPDHRLNASFSPTQPLPGTVSFISQSGALAVAILETAKQAHMGFAKMVSVGNKADLTDLDFLAYFGQDNHTDVIMIYQEGLDYPRHFLKLGRMVSQKKPVVILKGGRSESATRAAASHTGALATPTAIVQGLYRQAGIIETAGYEEFVYTALALSYWKCFEGKRLAVVTNAGGPGILTVDALSRAGLTIPPFSPELQSQLRTLLPPEAAIGNPVDMIASATEATYASVIETVLKSSEIDGIVVVIVRPPVHTTARAIGKALQPILQHQRKPVGVILLQEWDADAGLEVFHQMQVPVFPSPEIAAAAIHHATEYFNWRHQAPAIASADKPSSLPQPIPESVLQAQTHPATGVVAPEVVLEVLQQFDLTLVPYGIATSLDSALHLLKEWDTPVVVKLLAQEVAHKSDVGGVHLNIRTPHQLKAAWEALRKLYNSQKLSSPFRVLVQQQVTGRREMIIGLQREPGFDLVLMAGWGGILVEVLRQVVFRVWPLSLAEAVQMLHDLPARQLLEGVRGMEAVSLEAVAQILLTLGRIGATYPGLTSLEINPLMISDDGKRLWVVDARMVMNLPK